jgi:hypothetical protein
VRLTTYRSLIGWLGVGLSTPFAPGPQRSAGAQLAPASGWMSAVLPSAAAPPPATAPATTAVPADTLSAVSFEFSDAAKASLEELWRSSTAAHVERVACLGGVSTARGVAITRVHQVQAQADSLTVSAAAPLERCSTPEWLGTVHTHIARMQGQPYVTFSGADRSLNTMWRKRWQAEGVFCVLYSLADATCEVGDRFFGRAGYGPPESLAVGH